MDGRLRPPRLYPFVVVRIGCRQCSRSMGVGRCSPSLIYGLQRGVRGPKSAPVDGQHELFGFLTTEPNAVVAPIHPKAMPVILTTSAEIDLWLLADASKALELQRPLSDNARRVVASGEKEDGPRENAMLDWDQYRMLPL